jgi:hypothetical protein
MYTEANDAVTWDTPRCGAPAGGNTTPGTTEGTGAPPSPIAPGPATPEGGTPDVTVPVADWGALVTVTTFPTEVRTLVTPELNILWGSPELV